MPHRFFFLVLLFFCNTAMAQPVTISGSIVDANTDEPLIGAVVRVGDNGGVTDIDGRFSVGVDGNAGCRIKVSYVGYRSRELNCNGKTSFRIRLESDFVNLKDVEVTAKKFDVDSFLKRTQKRINGSYISNRTPLKAIYQVSLSDDSDTMLAANIPVYLWGGKHKPFSYTVYHDREKQLRVTHTAFNRKTVDNYIYNVMGILSGSFDKFLDKFLYSGDEMDMISSTFYVDSEKYYDIVYISRDSRRIANELLHGITLNTDTAGIKRYIWLHEFYINAQTTNVTFYQQIMMESSQQSYKEFSALKERNRIDDWLNKAKDARARYTNYKVVFQRDEDNRWMLKKETYTDRFWHPFYKGKDKKDFIYHFEYNVQRPVKDVPEQYEVFNPDIALRKYLAD